MLQHALYGVAAASLLRRLEPKPLVARGVYEFPSARGGGERVEIPPAQPRRPSSRVLSDLFDVMSGGAFVPADAEKECRYCDFSRACGICRLGRPMPSSEPGTPSWMPYRRLRAMSKRSSDRRPSRPPSADRAAPGPEHPRRGGRGFGQDAQPRQAHGRRHRLRPVRGGAPCGGDLHAKGGGRVARPVPAGTREAAARRLWRRARVRIQRALATWSTFSRAPSTPSARICSASGRSRPASPRASPSSRSWRMRSRKRRLARLPLAPAGRTFAAPSRAPAGAGEREGPGPGLRSRLHVRRGGVPARRRRGSRTSRLHGRRRRVLERLQSLMPKPAAPTPSATRSKGRASSEA